MPQPRISLTEYEDISGLERGQLLQCLTQEERERLAELGYRRKCRLTRGAMDYLMEVFPLPDHETEIVTLSAYEVRCGFCVGYILPMLSDAQRQKLVELGYRKYCRLPYRAIVYLRSLKYY